jgi:hypothetical protein
MRIVLETYIFSSFKGIYYAITQLPNLDDWSNALVQELVPHANIGGTNYKVALNQIFHPAALASYSVIDGIAAAKASIRKRFSAPVRPVPASTKPPFASALARRCRNIANNNVA